MWAKQQFHMCTLHLQPYKGCNVSNFHVFLFKSAAGCGVPGPVANAQIIPTTDFNFDAVVVYRCDAGFQTTMNGQVSGVLTRRCQQNGLWTAGPACTPISSVALQPQSEYPFMSSN